MLFEHDGTELRRFVGISETNRIVQFTARSNSLTNVHKDQFILITNAQIATRGEKLFVTMGVSSKIFQTSAFDVDHIVVNEYLQAPIVSMSAALGSPDYRRVSVTGTVANATFEEGQGWQRRDVRLTDGIQQVKCKIWGTQENPPPNLTIEESVQLRNMQVKSFRDLISLNSTDETTCNVTDAGAPQHVWLDGYNVNGDMIHFVTQQGAELTLPAARLTNIHTVFLLLYCNTSICVC